jgi:hypothetical protein
VGSPAADYFASAAGELTRESITVHALPGNASGQDFRARSRNRDGVLTLPFLEELPV